MNDEKDDWIFKARKSLIDSILEKIDLSKEPDKIYSSTFYEIAKVGLLKKAEKLNLLDKDQWQHKENHPELMKKIEQFLWDEIK